MTNDFVALFKDTSVVSIIAVVELTKELPDPRAKPGSLDYVGIGLRDGGAVSDHVGAARVSVARRLEQALGVKAFSKGGGHDRRDSIQSHVLRRPAYGDMRIEVTDLSKRYGDRQVLSGVSLTVVPGETVALIGPSGGGKSTLLAACLNGLNSFRRRRRSGWGPHRLTGRGSPAVRRRPGSRGRKCSGFWE